MLVMGAMIIFVLPAEPETYSLKVNIRQARIHPRVIAHFPFIVERPESIAYRNIGILNQHLK